MTQTGANQRIYRLRTRPKDIGVALIAALCLLGGLALMLTTTGSTRPFQSEATPLRLAYPASWITAADLAEPVIFRASDPVTPGAYKTNIVVESRPLDPGSPPTLQTLLDRRVEQRQQLTGYHFLEESEAEVAGARAIVTEYAYVVQPIDEARRASLPVVVRAREYIVVTADQSYYVTLSAPEAAYEEARRAFDRVIGSMALQ